MFRANLTLGCDPSFWETAARDYFHARLNSRYLMPISAILSEHKLKGEGFSIVAMQCSLIEFLESTVQGLTYAHRSGNSKKPLGDYEYSNSQKLFMNFLRKRNPFKEDFATKRLASDFYVNVRCGLLHEAQTRNNWLIHAHGKRILDVADPNRKIIYSSNFQDALLVFIHWYETELVKETELQVAFIRKFNSLCSV